MHQAAPHYTGAGTHRRISGSESSSGTFMVYYVD